MLHRSKLMVFLKESIMTTQLNHILLSAKDLLAALRQIWTELTLSAEARAQKNQQAYLNQAVDIYDLEHRIRNWDKQAHLPSTSLM